MSNGHEVADHNIDLAPNDRSQTAFPGCAVSNRRLRNMGAREVVARARTGHWSVVPYQSTHTVAGAIMVADPSNRRYEQVSVDQGRARPVVEASASPQNSGFNPTGIVGALAFKAADAIRNLYLKATGPLVRA